jgi:predicted RNA-binding protein Jag
MRSIIQEASSITKAIEQGWIKAGKPKEFTVKIFEEPKKGFLGITLQSAKIGIFFDEKKSEQVAITKPKEQPAHTQITEPKETKISEKKRTKEVEKPIVDKRKKEQQGPKSLQQVWTPQMQSNVKQWLEEIFNIINLPKPEFSIQPQNFYLRIKFNQSIFDDKSREKHFFTSLAILLIQMLKQKYKRPLKGYKVIFQNA